MFSSITATGVVAAAGGWVTPLTGIVLIVLGLLVTFTLLNWVVAKFRSGGGRKKRRK
jgi:hypothetical protein